MWEGSYKDLIAGLKGIKPVAMIYHATEGFPWHEQFGLSGQPDRAAVSVLRNRAEGEARHSNRGLLRFLRHAPGSFAEIKTQVVIAQQRKSLSPETTRRWTQRLDERGHILSVLINSIKEHGRTQDSGLRTNL